MPVELTESDQYNVGMFSATLVCSWSFALVELSRYGAVEGNPTGPTADENQQSGDFVSLCCIVPLSIPRGRSRLVVLMQYIVSPTDATFESDLSAPFWAQNVRSHHISNLEHSRCL